MAVVVLSPAVCALGGVLSNVGGYRSVSAENPHPASLCFTPLADGPAREGGLA